MSLSTEERIKAFLNRQKEKTTHSETTTTPTLKSEPNVSREINTSVTNSRDKGFETSQTLLGGINNVSLEAEYRTRSNNQYRTDDASVDLNFDDLEIRMDYIKTLGTPQTLPQPHPRTFQTMDFLPKEKSKASSYQRANTTASEDISPNSKTSEPTRRQEGLHGQEEAFRTYQAKSKSPLDRFFDQKTSFKKKIKKSVGGNSRDNRSYSSVKSRNKTPHGGQEDDKKESQPKEVRSPRWNSNAGIKPMKSVGEVEYNCQNSLSPRTPNKAVSKEKGHGKSESMKKSVDKGNGSRSPDHVRPKESSEVNPGLGMLSKTRPEFASLEKLLKNKVGFYSSGDLSPIRGRGGDNMKDSINKKKRVSSKSPETPSYDDEHQTRSQTSMGMTQQHITPEKRSCTEELEENDAGRLSYSTEGAGKIMEKIKKTYSSYEKTQHSRGGSGQSFSNQQEQEHNAFKAEIKALLATINEDKEQVLKKLEETSNKLEKYKKSYRYLKAELEGYKGIGLTGDEKLRLNTNLDSSGSIDGDDDNLQDAKKTPIKRKLKKKKTNELNNVFEPFTIEQLNLRSPKARENPRDQQLYSHVQEINDHVTELVSKSPIKKETAARFSDIANIEQVTPFEFEKHPTSHWVLKKMGLDAKVFNRDYSTKANPMDLTCSDPKDKDEIIDTQREMIAFLYKKLLVEEKQRLATEEQANIMISTMERSLAQLEGKKKYPDHKKQESTGAPNSEQLSKLTITDRFY